MGRPVLHHWTPAADATLRLLNSAGETDPVIAGRMGLTSSAVLQRRRKLLLPANVARPWTPSDDDELRRLYRPLIPRAELCAALNRSPAGIRDRVCVLGLGLWKMKFWTAERDAVLREMAASGATDAAIGERMGANANRVLRRRTRLGIKAGFKPGPRWKQEWMQKVEGIRNALADRLGVDEVAARFGVNKEVVRRERRALGLAVEPMRRLWSAAMDEQLRNDYGIVPAETIASALSVSLNAVYKRACQLTLTVPQFARLTGIHEGIIREMHAAGYWDSAIARRLGVSRETVSGQRRKLGLPRNRAMIRWTPEQDAELTAAYPDPAADMKALSVRFGVSVTALYQRANKLGIVRGDSPDRKPSGRIVGKYDTRQEWHAMAADFAARYGLPPDLKVRQVQVLVALIDGPATLPEIARRLGGSNELRSPPQSIWRIAPLIARGLVAKVVTDHGKGRGKGGVVWKYMLTLPAVELIANAQRRGDSR